jgi:hypothetical protein
MVEYNNIKLFYVFIIYKIMVATVSKKKYNKQRRDAKKYKKLLEDPLLDHNGLIVSNPTIVDQPSDLSTDEKINYQTKSGYIAQSSAYKTLYNNYYDGYLYKNDVIEQKDEDLYNLQHTPLTGLEYSYVTVKGENNLIQNQIKDQKEVYSVDNQKVYYRSQQIINLKTITRRLFYVYFILFIAFTAVIIMNNSLTILSKILIIIVMGLYPYIIDSVIQLIVFLYNYLVATIQGKVYHSNK